MAASTDRPRTVAELLDGVFRRIDPQHNGAALRLWSVWADVVGPAIAARAHPQRLRDGVLFVVVATHSWLQELQYAREDLRARLNARLPTPLVRDIVLAVGAVPTAPEDEVPSRVLPTDLTPLVPLPALSDPGLAAAFAGVLGARSRRLARNTPAAPRVRRTRS